MSSVHFTQVRVFIPYREGNLAPQRQDQIEREIELMIDDAFANGLAIIVCLWGSDEWAADAALGRWQIAQRWGHVTQLWRRYDQRLTAGLDDPVSQIRRDAPRHPRLTEPVGSSSNSSTSPRG